MKLEGKRIVISGGGSGIGLELARRLIERTTVVIGGRDPARLVATIELFGREVIPRVREMLADDLEAHAAPVAGARS